LLSAFSMRRTQEAHVMPVTGNVISWVGESVVVAMLG